ncbi:MAG: GNAT family N-acetyltransferase [Thalassobaculum sp.]|uniref:GNAT family N-acetyltransferase n=1 Tax=Thalassobaculum sp. TaxID=2022740 RepID=UPI0032EC4725
MTDTIVIRPAVAADLPALRGLWERCGLHPSASDTDQRLAALIEFCGGLFLAALRDGEIVGSVMASWDGRRGWINRLAVDPAARGGRLGDRLMTEAEGRLAAIGCDKVNLLIEPDNAGVERFYRRLGYGRDELIFMEKWL